MNTTAFSAGPLPSAMAQSALNSSVFSTIGGGVDAVKQLMLTKQAELHEISEYRGAMLEGLLREKESELDALRSKLARIKEDFNYNLTLFTERDSELDRLEASLRDSLEREAALQRALDETRSIADDNARRAEGEASKVKELEAFYAAQLAAMSDSLRAGRESHDRDLAQLRSELEKTREAAAATVRQAEEAAAAKLSSIQTSHEDALNRLRAELRAREDAAAAAIREANERAATAQANSSALESSLAVIRTSLADSEARANNLSARLENAQSDLQGKLQAAQRERDAALESRQALLEAYEGKTAELVSSLQAVEQAFVSQRSDYERRLAQASSEASSSAAHGAAISDARLSALVARLTELEESNSALAASAAAAKADAESARARLAASDDRSRTLARDGEAAREQAAAVSARAAADTAALRSVAAEASSALDRARADAERARADASSALERCATLEREVTGLNAAWEARWSSREAAFREGHESWAASTREAYEGHLQALVAQRDAMHTQLAAALAALGDGAAPQQQAQQQQPAAFSTAPTTHWQVSSGPTGSAGGPGASALSELDRALAAHEQLMAHALDDATRATGAQQHRGPVQAQAQARTFAGVDEQQQRLEAAVQQRLSPLQQEVAALRAALAQKDDQLRQQHAQQQGALPKQQQQQHQIQQQTAESELAALRGRCGELESQTARFREVIGGMRREMEAMVAGGSTVTGGSGVGAPSPQDARTWRREDATVEDSRGAQNGRFDSSSGSGQTNGVAPQLAATNADVARLLREREGLLEMSNQLRADLHRATSGAGSAKPQAHNGGPAANGSSGVARSSFASVTGESIQAALQGGASSAGGDRESGSSLQDKWMMRSSLPSGGTPVLRAR